MITIDEAIKGNHEARDLLFRDSKLATQRHNESIQLGIEALELLKVLREAYTEFSDIHIVIDHIQCLLPSETEGGK